jgi:hypothetical protein
VIIAIGIGDSEAYRYSVEESQIVNALSRGRLAAGGVEEVSRELAHGARDNLNDLTDRCFNHSTVSIGRPGVRVNRWFSVAIDCSNTQGCIVNRRAKTEGRFLAVARKSPLRFEGAEAVSLRRRKRYRYTLLVRDHAQQ